MRDGNFAKHPLTHPGWFTFGPTIGKPPRLAFVASQHFFIARLRHLYSFSNHTPAYFKLRSRPLLPVNPAYACSAIWTAVSSWREIACRGIVFGPPSMSSPSPHLRFHRNSNYRTRSSRSGCCFLLICRR